MDTLGRRLKALLQHKGMTQAELAARMGIAQGVVSTWCTDKHILPALRAITISRNLHVPLDWLYGTLDNTEHMTVQDAENLYAAMNQTLEILKQRRIRALEAELKELIQTKK